MADLTTKTAAREESQQSHRRIDIRLRAQEFEAHHRRIDLRLRAQEFEASYRCIDTRLRAQGFGDHRRIDSRLRAGPDTLLAAWCSIPASKKEKGKRTGVEEVREDGGERSDGEAGG
jgi:hypothetical protein